MSTQKDYDYLKLKSNQNILKIIQLETILFTERVVKTNKFFISQQRNLLITNEALYNLNNMELKRRICLKNILGFTVSSKTTEFVLHCRFEDYDYHFNSLRRKHIIDTINKDASISDLLNPVQKIHTLLDDYNQGKIAEIDEDQI